MCRVSFWFMLVMLIALVFANRGVVFVVLGLYGELIIFS